MFREKASVSHLRQTAQVRNGSGKDEYVEQRVRVKLVKGKVPIDMSKVKAKCLETKLT